VPSRVGISAWGYGVAITFDGRAEATEAVARAVDGSGGTRASRCGGKAIFFPTIFSKTIMVDAGAVVGGGRAGVDGFAAGKTEFRVAGADCRDAIGRGRTAGGTAAGT